MARDPQVRVRLAPALLNEPIWLVRPDGGCVPVLPEWLALSPALTADITAWDAELQSHYDEDYPPDSHFPTPEEAWAWADRGPALAERLADELGRDVVLPRRVLSGDRRLVHPARPDGTRPAPTLCPPGTG